MKIERTKNAKRNMIFGTSLRLYQILIPFLMRSFIVYCLGVQYLGLNSLFTSVLQVLNLAELGVGSAMVYSMYEPITKDDTITICALMNLYKWYYRIIGAVVLIAGVALTPFIPKLIKGEIPADINIYILYLLNLFATVLTYWLLAYRNSVLQAYQRVDVVSKVNIITDTAKYILQIGALFAFKNYYLYVIAILVSQMAMNIITALESKKMYPQINPVGKLPKEATREINKRIKDLFTAKLGTTIVNSADTIVISSFLGLTALAIYQNYYFIMTAVIGVIGVLLSACTAGIGNSLIVETIEKNYIDFKKFNFMLTWLTGICVCCFLNLYQPFMTLWMGGENLLSMGCVILMCMYFYLYTVNHFMCTYKDAAGMWHEDRFRPLIAALVNLTLNLLLVRYIGLFAIILSTVVSYIVVTIPWLIYNLFTVIFKMLAKDFIKKFIKYIIIVCLSAAISYVICIRLPKTGIITIVLRSIVSFTIPNIVFLIFLGHGQEFEGSLEMVDRLTQNKLCKITNIFRKGV